MFKEFFLFELRGRLRQPMLYIFALVNFFLIFSASVSDSVQVGGSIGNVHVNSPHAIMFYSAIMTLITLLMTTAFMNTSALRDYAVQYDQILFSTPLKKFGYLGGRFLGAVVAATLPSLGIFLAIWFAGMSPWVDAKEVGPFYLGAYVNSFFLFILPNTLFIGAIIFALAALYRSSVISFIGAIILMVGYGISGSLMADLDNELVAKMLDPFGIRTFSLETKYWTQEDKNTMWLGFSGPLLLNRILWIAVALGVFALTYVRFSFTKRKERRKRKGAVAHSPQLQPVIAKLKALPAVQTRDDWSAGLTQLWHQTKIEFWGIAKSTAFVVILIAGMLNMGFAVQNVNEMFGTGNHPVTYLMVDAIRGTLYLFLIAIMMYYSGILVWKERDAKMNEFFDASPYPSWVPFLAKFAALLGMVAIILIAGIVIGVLTQMSQGYDNLQLGVYVRELLVYDLMQFGLFILLAFWVQAMVNNKYVGYLVFLVLIIANSFIWDPLNVSSNLVIYSGVPSHTYSDLNGWAPFAQSKSWFYLYWIAFGGLMAVATVLFWVRGKANNWAQRVGIAKQSFNRPTAFFSGGFALVWILIGGFLYYNTKVVNEIIVDEQVEKSQATYEETYKKYEGIAQPRVTDVKYDIEIYPDQRDFLATAQVSVLNKTNQPIDSLHFSMPAANDFEGTVDIAGAKLVSEDKDLAYNIYELASPLQPGQRLDFTVRSKYVSQGIENEVSNTNVVPNGTFVNNATFMPTIGYAAQRELGGEDERAEQGLAEKPRMPELHANCGKSCHNTYISSDADWVNVETVISTSGDQLAIAPGSLIEEWEEDNRRYFRYRVDHKALNFYSFVSGAYAVERDKWTGPNGQTVDVEIYYHPGHEYNVDKMVKSVKKTLDYCTKNFSPYPHKQARIIEFPRYASFAQAFPGTMPYSESIGFIADLTEEDAIDFVYYVVAHEMGHQWWAHQVIGALVQGATMMSETFAQYTALMIMEKEYGRDKMKQFLEYEMDRYLRGRGGERRAEQPLLYNENQPYIHYRKGSVVMYALKDYIGEDSLNMALRNYLKDVAYQEPPYTTSLQCYDYLKAATPDSLQYLLEDMFEKIVLYSNRTTEATYKELSNGKYEVKLTVEVSKFEADSVGLQTPVPFNDWIDIGVLAEAAEGKQNNRLLKVERHRISEPTTTFTLVVDEKPLEAGIDPNYLLIDRFPDDNVKKLSLEE